MLSFLSLLDKNLLAYDITRSIPSISWGSTPAIPLPHASQGMKNSFEKLECERICADNRAFLIFRKDSSASGVQLICCYFYLLSDGHSKEKQLWKNFQ